MASSESKIAKIQNSFNQLSAQASDLNTVSDEFSKAVGLLDDAIRDLSVGLTAWVTYQRWDEGPDYGMDQIGYTKIDGEWGIALRTIVGSQLEDYEQTKGVWLFSNSPREMRIESVDKLPELVAALCDVAHKTARKIAQKTIEAQELVAAIGVRPNQKGDKKAVTRGQE